VLAAEGLTVRLRAETGSFDVVAAMDLAVAAGETLAIVGESGCGKTMTALALMRLLPEGAAVAAGTVRLDGQDILALPERAVEDLRGSRIAMVFQEPLTALNPVMTVGAQIAEAVVRHRGLGGRAAWAAAVEALRRVRMPDPAARARAYPHELSGGMRQRAVIAMALVNRPRVILADEPTTALDVTIQAQILALIATLQAELGSAVVLITHDLGVVAEAADRVIVMYAGRKVEEAEVTALFDAPLHPYTRGLMAAVPRGRGGARLADIPGTVPSLAALPPGCAFAPRCPLAGPRCRSARPPLTEPRPGHRVACWERGA